MTKKYCLGAVRDYLQQQAIVLERVRDALQKKGFYEDSETTTGWIQKTNYDKRALLPINKKLALLKGLDLAIEKAQKELASAQETQDFF